MYPVTTDINMLLLPISNIMQRWPNWDWVAEVMMMRATVCKHGPSPRYSFLKAFIGMVCYIRCKEDELLDMFDNSTTKIV